VNDLRGNVLGTASAAACEAAEQALWRLMSFYDVPLPTWTPPSRPTPAGPCRT
jgi:non-ribosomal peptide synthetase component F